MAGDEEDKSEKQKDNLRLNNMRKEGKKGRWKKCVIFKLDENCSDRHRDYYDRMTYYLHTHIPLIVERKAIQLQKKDRGKMVE